MTPKLHSSCVGKQQNLQESGQETAEQARYNL